MELEFIPRDALLPVKPCFLLCGQNGDTEWARDLLKSKLSDGYKIVERDQFIPSSKSVKGTKQTKDFVVSLDWISNFTERFVLIVELFLLIEGSSDSQIMEDIIFASKFAREFAYEHIAVILSNKKVPPARGPVFKSQLKNVAFLSQEQGEDLRQITELIKNLTSSQYKEMLRKKYQKRAVSNIHRFMVPWSCRSFYNFKSAMAFEGACEIANALREYHASYSAIIEEGNTLVAKGESKVAFCEHTRSQADIILLRMVQCMFKIGSLKEAGAFLKGHLTWYDHGIGGPVGSISWKVTMYCHYGWLMEPTTSSEYIHPGIYFSQAIQLALLLFNEQVFLGPTTNYILCGVAKASISHYSNWSQKRREILERMNFSRFLISSEQFDDLDTNLTEILSNKVAREWPDVLIPNLKMAIARHPDNLKYIWEYSSLSENWTFFQDALNNCNQWETLEFPETLNKIILVSANFDQNVCECGQECFMHLHVRNNSNVKMEIKRIETILTDGSSIKYDVVFDAISNAHVQIPFRVFNCGELDIQRIILSLSSVAIALVFNPGSFIPNESPLRINRPIAELLVESEVAFGLVNSENVFGSLSIKNKASNPVHGVVKIVKAPADLIIGPAFPFGVSGHGSNVMKMPIRSVVPVEGTIQFDIEYSCDGYDCEILTDCILPFHIREPLDVKLDLRRRVVSFGASTIEEMFEWVISLDVVPNINCEAVIRLAGHQRSIVLKAQERIEFVIPKLSMEKILIEWSSLTCKENGKLALNLPHISTCTVFAFFAPSIKQMIMVSESSQCETVLFAVEKMGPILVQGPKRLTRKVECNSITRLPISYTIANPKGECVIEASINGVKGKPDWLDLEVPNLAMYPGV